MATIPIPNDFKEFLKLLNVHKVRYLLIGGYAVNYHGYVRATADMDIFVKPDKRNAERLVAALIEFGFDVEELSSGLFLNPDNVIRMGVPPLRIEIMSSITGVDFEECYENRIVDQLDDVTIHLISLDKLKKNKHAAGRLKDRNDLEHLQ
jgi:hypothetical protein